MKCSKCGMEYLGKTCPCGYPARDTGPSKKKPFLLRYWWILPVIAIISFFLGFDVCLSYMRSVK